MKKQIILLCCVLLSWHGMAQDESLTLTLSNDQYKQIENHFSKKWEEKKWKSDWAQFYRYEDQNNSLQKPVKVVFMGNSITDGWAKKHPDFFTENDFAGRGISGQTTSQMLVRFQSDVIDLQPKMVVILAGVNDIAQNNGTISLKHICQNIQSMCELAKLHKIKPVICSALPAYQFYWHKALRPAEEIRQLNAMLEQYAKENGITYVDYYSAFADERGGMPEKYAADGVHPTAEGYEVMEAIILKTIRKYVKK